MTWKDKKTEVMSACDSLYLQVEASIAEDIHYKVQQLIRIGEKKIKERDRLGVLAVKWCDKKHHDWDEILNILDQPNEP